MKKSFADKKISGNEAVSPVVGVMLMLVVTIIIAAVVSAFAGGLTESTDKAPQVSLKGTYSQTEGLTFTHQGGDTIGTLDTVVIIRLTDTFGDVEHYAWPVNATTIVNKRGVKVGQSEKKTTGYELGSWLTSGGSSGVKSFAPGDTAYIEPPYHTSEFLQDGTKFTGAYSFDNVSSVGREFWLELTDKSGKTFAKTRVKIAP